MSHEDDVAWPDISDVPILVFIIFFLHEEFISSTINMSESFLKNSLLEFIANFQTLLVNEDWPRFRLSQVQTSFMWFAVRPFIYFCNSHLICLNSFDVVPILFHIIEVLDDSLLPLGRAFDVAPNFELFVGVVNFLGTPWPAIARWRALPLL